MVERPQYDPTSSMGRPGTARAAANAASHSASPSSAGMKPLVRNARARRSALSTSFGSFGVGAGTNRTMCPSDSPAVPVDDRVGLGAQRRLEVGADGVGQRCQAGLLDLGERDA